MSSIIKELWVFSGDGSPIVDFCEEKKIDENFIGGFITAIKAFSTELTGKDLKSFTIENNKFTCTSALEGNVILACRCASSTNDKTIQKLCTILVQIFNELYKPSDIKNWNGNSAYFDKYKKRIDLYFKLGNL